MDSPNDDDVIVLDDELVNELKLDAEAYNKLKNEENEKKISKEKAQSDFSQIRTEEVSKNYRIELDGLPSLYSLKEIDQTEDLHQLKKVDHLYVKTYDPLALNVKIQKTITPYYLVPYENQIKEKDRALKAHLRRFGNELSQSNPELEKFVLWHKIRRDGQICEVDSFVESPDIKEYCNKCEFTIGKCKNTGKPVVGFQVINHKKGSFHVGPVTHLTHLNNKIKKVVKLMEIFLETSTYEAYDSSSDKGVWRQLAVRTSDVDVMLVVKVNPREMSKEEIYNAKEALKSFFICGDGHEGGVTSIFIQQQREMESGKEPEYEHIYGKTYIEETILGKSFRAPPDSFHQVSTSASKILYKKIAKIVIESLSDVLDIGCGVGTIGLSVVERDYMCMGVDENKKAIAYAEANAAMNNIGKATFFHGKAEDYMPNLLEKPQKNNIIAIIHPPKAGLNVPVINALRKCYYVKKVVYVSCDLQGTLPTLLNLGRARNRNCKGAFFVPIRVIPVDLFPETPNYGVIVLFERYDDFKWMTIMIDKPRPEDREYYKRIPPVSKEFQRSQTDRKRRRSRSKEKDDRRSYRRHSPPRFYSHYKRDDRKRKSEDELRFRYPSRGKREKISADSGKLGDYGGIGRSSGGSKVGGDGVSGASSGGGVGNVRHNSGSFGGSSVGVSNGGGRFGIGSLGNVYGNFGGDVADSAGSFGGSSNVGVTFGGGIVESASDSFGRGSNSGGTFGGGIIGGASDSYGRGNAVGNVASAGYSYGGGSVAVSGKDSSGHGSRFGGGSIVDDGGRFLGIGVGDGCGVIGGSGNIGGGFGVGVNLKSLLDLGNGQESARNDTWNRGGGLAGEEKQAEEEEYGEGFQEGFEACLEVLKKQLPDMAGLDDVLKMMQSRGTFGGEEEKDINLNLKESQIGNTNFNNIVNLLGGWASQGGGLGSSSSQSNNNFQNLGTQPTNILNLLGGGSQGGGSGSSNSQSSSNFQYLGTQPTNMNLLGGGGSQEGGLGPSSSQNFQYLGNQPTNIVNLIGGGISQGGGSGSSSRQSSSNFQYLGTRPTNIMNLLYGGGSQGGGSGSSSSQSSSNFQNLGTQLTNIVNLLGGGVSQGGSSGFSSSQSSSNFQNLGSQPTNIVNLLGGGGSQGGGSGSSSSQSSSNFQNLGTQLTNIVNLLGGEGSQGGCSGFSSSQSSNNFQYLGTQPTNMNLLGGGGSRGGGSGSSSIQSNNNFQNLGSQPVIFPQEFSYSGGWNQPFNWGSREGGGNFG